MPDTLVKFRTPRLIVRLWTMEDAEAGYRLYSDPEIMKYSGGGGGLMESVDKMRQTIERIHARYESDGHRLGSWPMIEAETGEFVGVMILVRMPNSEELEVAWYLLKEHWGKGYGTEGARAAIRHAFEELGLPVVYALVFPENTRSINLCKRLGMTPLGQTDQYYGHTLEKFEIRP